MFPTRSKKTPGRIINVKEPFINFDLEGRQSSHGYALKSGLLSEYPENKWHPLEQYS